MLDPMTSRQTVVTAQATQGRGLFDGDSPVRPIHLLLSAHRFLALITSLYSCHIAQRDVLLRFLPSSHAVRTSSLP